ncbi:MAG: AI-2E family transporter [Phycisphaerales bacterium]|nr:MAG: AI-2E family transporter [Phycisphaerales bacterium]
MPERPLRTPSRPPPGGGPAADERGPRYTFDRVVRMTLTAAAAVALFTLLRYLSDVLVPFAAAAVLAYLLNPLVNAFEAKLHRRWAAVSVTLGGGMIVGFAIAIVVAALSVRQYDQFSRSLSRWRETFQAAAADLDAISQAIIKPTGASPADGSAGQGPAPSAGTDAPAGVDASVGGDHAAAQPGEEAAAATPADKGRDDADQPGNEKSFTGWRELPHAWSEFRAAASTRTPRERVAALMTRLEGTLIGRGLRSLAQRDDYDQVAVDLARRVLRGGWNVVSAGVDTVLGLTVLIVVALYLWFLLLDYPHYARNAREFIPPQYRPALLEFAHEFEIVMRRYFRGQAIVALLVGILFMVGFSLIGLPLAVPFGMFVGLLNVVPYLQAVALVPAGMLAVMRAIEHDGSLAWSLGLVLLVFLIAQLVQDVVLTPRIMAGATGLRPVAILLGVFIWGKLLGFLGLLLAIPLTCVGIAYYRRLVLKHAPDATAPGTG